MSSDLNKLVGKRVADRYCITGTIGKGGMGVVYRAIPFDDPSDYVAIKLIQRDGQMGSDDLLRFQKEAALMSQLYHPNIIYFHELGLFSDADEGIGSGYYIVMEIASGRNLKEILQRDGRRDLSYFFQVGLQVSDALSYTHAKSIVHRDIKPHNIIVAEQGPDARGLGLKVLDFGVARLADAIHQKSRAGRKTFEDYAGTPLYMAPEQTALMDAPVDHRVDLYSLGCVLYEVLAGKPPFTANTREKLERQHCFATQEPLAAVRPDIPPAVEEIVHKLLAKHPDQRYQTAFGLYADLKRAQTRYETRRAKGFSFPLGLKDRFQSVSAHIPLAGREEARERLIAGYQALQSAQGRAQMAVITGSSGLGKTRLLAEFRGWLADHKSRFISCSFSQHENALDFNALANAFNEYLYRVNKSQPHEAEEIRNKVKANLGPAAHWVAEVVPGLKPFISEEIEELGPGLDGYDSPAFVKAFSDFTKCLAAENQPLVFMIDNLHWADAKSLKLIDEFFSQGNSLRFYLVVSLRPVTDAQRSRVGQFLEKFSRLKRRYHEIVLTPFNAESVQKVLASVLQSEQASREDLVAWIMEQSAGLPMHVVELIRALVARDLLYLDEKTGEWKYDLATIQATPMQLDSIDLVLTRILGYGDSDRRVLEIAATAGLTFQFETLLIEGRAQASAVAQSLERAEADGLLRRIPEDEDLKHLGKAFSFAHKKARDTIYEHIPVDRRRVLHEAIGVRMEALRGERVSPQSIFALAHHFSTALTDGKTSSLELAKHCVRANVAAGDAARRSQSWMSAERYFENAWQVMEDWGDRLSRPQERAQIMEALADLAAVQRRLSEAMEKMGKVLASDLSPTRHAEVAIKAVRYHSQAGRVTDSFRLIQETLAKVGLRLPQGGLADWALLGWNLLWDGMTRDVRRGRSFQALRMAWRERSKSGASSPKGGLVPAAALYEAGVDAMLRMRPSHALLLHEAALRHATREAASPEVALRMAARRAALLGYAGFVSPSYRLFDLCMELGGQLKSRGPLGFVCLYRAQTLDYMKNRFDELADDLDRAEGMLLESGERQAGAEVLVFKGYRQLLLGDIGAMARSLERVGELVPARNWLASREVAFTIFAHLLQGSRDIVARKGETFLRRRRRAQGRLHDQFSLIVQTLVALARGEIDRTREFYQRAVQRFAQGQSREYLHPFEEDFVALFAVVVPALVEQEQGRHLMREGERRETMRMLVRRVSSQRAGSGAIALLVKARCRDILGKGRVPACYDEAMRASLMTGNILTQFFGNVWFGEYLIARGQPMKAEYIRRAMQIARSKQLKGLSDLAEQALRRHRQEAVVETSESQSVESRARVGAMHTELVLESLRLVSQCLSRESELTEDLARFFGATWSHAYSTGKILLLAIDEQGRPLRQVFGVTDGGREEEIKEYASPYINIRSTLFLPASDAPWVNPASRRRSLAQFAASSSEAALGGDTIKQHDAGDNAATIFIDAGISASATVTMSASATGAAEGQDERTQVVESSVEPPTPESSDPTPAERTGGVTLNAIIPLRVAAGNIGILFIENIDLKGKDSALCRHELDAFGAQIGLVVARKGLGVVSADDTTSAPKQVERVVYQPGSHAMETVPWLMTWSEGALRATRETTWYEGLSFGENQYLLAFCHLTGPAEIREELGSMIWYHLRVLRALSGASGRAGVDLGEIREEMAGLLAADPRAGKLTSIGLAFSVFDRQTRLCTSGHFGTTRPVLMNLENHITPFNDVVIRMSGGQDLRYWEVVAEIQGPHVYVLTADSSRLDSAMAATSRQRFDEVFASAVREREGRALVNAAVMPEHRPRFYLGAVMIPEVTGQTKTVTVTVVPRG